MLLRALRRVKRLLRPPAVVGRVAYKCHVMRLGTEYGGWTFNPTALDAHSVVYSAGIGDDISFDLGLIERFGVTVHAFDPTPKSLEWLRSQPLPANLVVHDYGIAAHDGELTFYRPENPAYMSLSVVERATPTATISLPVRELAGIMRELGHSSIDLLKIDIEGAEYAVLQDLVARAIPIRQLLVEFHHRFPGIGNYKTQKAIDLLESNGYRLFAISPSGEEYSFLKI
jgi:FkbM family methyltransferase